MQTKDNLFSRCQTSTPNISRQAKERRQHYQAGKHNYYRQSQHRGTTKKYNSSTVLIKNRK